MSIKLAVGMCVYINDDLECLKSSINSIIKQKVGLHLYINVDGPVTISVKNYLDSLMLNNVTIMYADVGKGLAFRLNEIIEVALINHNYEFFGRMDADDISSIDRFEKQIDFLTKNREIDVVGSDVIEISDVGDDVFYKKMESSHDKLSKSIIKKCPFNHPSVMFRMSIFNEGFRYKSKLKNTQDYYLWVDLLAGGKKFSNINEPLLRFRVNSEFHSRRGLKKAINDIKSRLYAFEKLDVLTLGNILHTINLFFLRIAPRPIKIWAYKHLR